ncbi:MAG TPA: hypothetical protein DHV69_02115, partial [Sphaerochaeta sp.]|nr:hypothetical protein [Sphaerochaeta sp.]
MGFIDSRVDGIDRRGEQFDHKIIDVLDNGIMGIFAKQSVVPDIIFACLLGRNRIFPELLKKIGHGHVQLMQVVLVGIF